MDKSSYVKPFTSTDNYSTPYPKPNKLKQSNSQNIFGMMTSVDTDLLSAFSNKDAISKEDFFLAFRHFNLSNQELQELFSFANIKKDDILSQDEWNAFSSIFIKPLLLCDNNHDHALNAHEIKECIFLHD